MSTCRLCGESPTISKSTSNKALKPSKHEGKEERVQEEQEIKDENGDQGRASRATAMQHRPWAGGISHTSAFSSMIPSKMLLYVESAKPLSFLAFSSFSYLVPSLSGPK